MINCLILQKEDERKKRTSITTMSRRNFQRQITTEVNRSLKTTIFSNYIKTSILNPNTNILSTNTPLLNKSSIFKLNGH